MKIPNRQVPQLLHPRTLATETHGYTRRTFAKGFPTIISKVYCKASNITPGGKRFISGHFMGVINERLDEKHGLTESSFQYYRSGCESPFLCVSNHLR